MTARRDNSDGYFSSGHAGNAYFYVSCPAINHGFLRGYEAKIKNHGNCSLWKEKEKVTVTVDISKGKVTFFKEKKHLGNISLPNNTKNIVYCFALNVKSLERSEWKVL